MYQSLVENITYRPATVTDADRIAALHARSWQETYRGIMPDEFLDNEVENERLAVWQERFAGQPPDRHLIVAEAGTNCNLIKQAAGWVQQRDVASPFYLWVYEQNHPARVFYDSLGAINQEAVRGEYGVVLRYVWPDVGKIG